MKLEIDTKDDLADLLDGEKYGELCDKEKA